MLLILAASLLLSISVFVTLAYIMRKKLGFRKSYLLVAHLLLLIPWVLHYVSFLEMANTDNLPAVIYAIPVGVLAVAGFLVHLSTVFPKALNILIPGLAFLTTYYVIMPIGYAATPHYKFDNVPTIWLFVWTVVATLTLIAYLLPDIAYEDHSPEQRA